MIITTYIKYALMFITIALGVVGVSYVISNERDKSELKLINQSLDVQKQSFQQDLSQQQDITTKTIQHTLKRQQIANKVHSIKSLQIHNKTINELQKIKNCELQNINNLEVVCQ